MATPIIKFRIKSLGITDKEYKALPFGRQIEYAQKIKEFKEKAKRNHVGQKRITHAKAIAEFKKLNNVDEYWYSYHDDRSGNGFPYRDDAFEIFYTEKTNPLIRAAQVLNPHHPLLKTN